MLKTLVIILLIGLGIYLYRRAQRLAIDEQKQFDTKNAQQAASTDSSSTLDVADVDSKSELADTVVVTESSAEALSATSTAAQEPQTEAEETPAEVILAAEPEPEPEPEPAPAPAPAPAPEPEPANVSQKVELVVPDWANPALTKAITEASEGHDVTAKHQALLNVIAECYKQRKLPEYSTYGAALSSDYLAVFTEYLPVHQATTPDIDAKGIGFMQLSTLLNDTGDFDSAIALCERAIEYGLSDGTVTGFEGRLVRIQKAAAKAK